MDEIEHILERFTKKRAGGMHELLSQGIVHPHRDWLIALGAAAILALTLIGFNTVQFLEVKTDAMEQKDVRTPAPSVNRDLLERELERFDRKRAMLNELRTQKPSISQP